MMTEELNKQNVISDYEEGLMIDSIAFRSKITSQEVLLILRSYRDECKVNQVFNDDFKIMIAKRDTTNGLTRTSIAIELEVNPATIKKACEKFGNSLKEKATSSQEFTLIKGDFNQSACPSCASKKVNEVEENVIYCMDCGDEHIFKSEFSDEEVPVLIKSYILKVNYEWID